MKHKRISPRVIERINVMHAERQQRTDERDLIAEDLLDLREEDSCLLDPEFDEIGAPF